MMKFTVFKPSGDAARQPDAILRSTFKVGRYRCSMTLDCGAIVPGAAGNMRVEWEPKLPGRLTRRELNQYRVGRNALYAKAADAIGGNILLAE